MTTLLLRFSGRKQGWSDSTRLVRDVVENAPRKFEVLGILLRCISEPVSVSEFADLRFAVRVDVEGVSELSPAIEQITHFSRWMNKTSVKLQESKYRNLSYYKAATFVVGLEGDDGVLERIARGLRSPRERVFLGSHGCVPEGPLCLGMTGGDVLTALNEWEWIASDDYQAWHAEKVLPVFKEFEEGDGNVVGYYGVSISDISAPFRREGFTVSKVVRCADVTVQGAKPADEEKLCVPQGFYP